jgi:hypothetical protein
MVEEGDAKQKTARGPRERREPACFYKQPISLLFRLSDF